MSENDLILTNIAHRDCEKCAECAERARGIARATGSVEGTHREAQHFATVRRAGTFPDKSTDDNRQARADLMATMLTNACPYGDGEPDADGFRTYRIETHCTAFMIKARNTASGWQIKGFITDAA